MAKKPEKTEKPKVETTSALANATLHAIKRDKPAEE